MIVRYDRVGDTLDLILSRKQIHHAEEHGPIIINYDRRGEPVEIELLGASRLLGELLAGLLRARSEAEPLEVQL